MSGLTGLPLGGRFSPRSLISPPPDPGTKLIDKVEVNATGALRISCPDSEAACERRVFVRDAPNAERLSDCRFELLTGRDLAGVRLEPEALLAIPREGCGAP